MKQETTILMPAFPQNVPIPDYQEAHNSQERHEKLFQELAAGFGPTRRAKADYAFKDKSRRGEPVDMIGVITYTLAIAPEDRKDLEKIIKEYGKIFAAPEIYVLWPEGPEMVATGYIPDPEEGEE